MAKLRFDHVGVVVDDLEAVAAFFLGLGFERAGGAVVDGDDVDGINGLEGVRAELLMVRTPDGSGTLELVKYHRPVGDVHVSSRPANAQGYRHVCLEVEDMEAIVARLRAEGFGTVGEVRDYEDSWRLCYARGPEGLIVELAQRL